jgi:hypothetical protein
MAAPSYSSNYALKLTELSHRITGQIHLREVQVEAAAEGSGWDDVSQREAERAQSIDMEPTTWR